MIKGHEFKVGQYRAVSYYLCGQFLGDRFDMLLADPIRNKGPIPETVYPWNLVDYLCCHDPRC